MPPGKYLVDPASHEIRYVVDPGIGGRIREYRGHELKRLDSPKATLMALITDGILTHRLPWALVLIGVFLTIAIELMGVSSLPVAVGVYLPITTSAGMFAGGIVRWLVERRVRSDNRSLAEIESGPGVLFASPSRRSPAGARAAAKPPTGSPRPCRCITISDGSRRPLSSA